MSLNQQIKYTEFEPRDCHNLLHDILSMFIFDLEKHKAFPHGLRLHIRAPLTNMDK